jgi:hypothetical protein
VGTATVSFIKKSWPQSIAGAMMAAPAYLDLSHQVAALIFYGLGAFGVLGLFFEIWTEVRKPKQPGQSVRYRAWAAISFGAIILGICGWLFWPASIQGPFHAPPPPLKSAPEPPKPPEPWVSEEEARKAKNAGRLLLPFRAHELSRMNYTMGSQGTDAYVGQWVKIDDPLLTVSRSEKEKKEYLIVRILQPVWTALLFFDAKKWGDQIRTMNPATGAKVHAMCQLTKYEGKPNDMSAPQFVGSNCELL